MSILLKNIIKKYKEKKIIDDISLCIKPNTIVGLLGSNGAGKTTFFYIIVGLLRADSGYIFHNNINITNNSIYNRYKHGIRYLPQGSSIFHKLNVKDNIFSIIEIQKHISINDRKTILYDTLKKFNLLDIKNTIGINLSGGERRRVEIARCMITNPKYIFMDEPFAGVDPISINDIKNIIKKIKKTGVSIFITDHNFREILDICDNINVINSGKLIFSGSKEEILLNNIVKDKYFGI